MNCEIVELPDDVVYTKTEYRGRAILLIAKVTEHNSDKYWLCCHKCNLMAGLGDHDVVITDGKVTISPSISCPNDKCKAHYFIKNGVVC